MSKIWDPKRQQLRQYLKQLRDESGLTQGKLAEKLNKPQSYVSKYESGERNLDFVETIEICEACGAYNIETLVNIVSDK
ncbi:helix-turn-helix transcriptional regulator [Psychrosphaera sp. 1_MG-2023]|uniref:Helix-turn-helix transcriptional regulator n=1 Tax=Psychrosphaera algicola TaxID=3023714 RepID=A0ABT5FDK8_9GAMM|nr:MULTISPECIES: helix-turn-helix transcriptional regulator [unclassified Psychrosphaera]MDC2889204.1 helix-turn-helix transcriptional regulator [Psychrosphaera sp. G1-22]MDO6720647.1 helix-turn-helix transcriptional regulator [Psychrosphaera sp. 1_MG-2023]